MKFVSILLLSMYSISFTYASPTSTPPQVTVEDFKLFIGTHTGELSYKDYTGDGWVTLGLVGATYIEKKKLVMEHLIVEGEALYRQKYILDFKNGKAILNGTSMEILKNNFSKDTTKKEMVLSHKGKDGNENKKCTFRHTITYENNTITLVKEVKFDDETEYFVRNQYVLRK